MHNASRAQVRRRALGESRVRLATIAAATTGVVLTTAFGFLLTADETSPTVVTVAVSSGSAERADSPRPAAGEKATTTGGNGDSSGAQRSAGPPADGH